MGESISRSLTQVSWLVLAVVVALLFGSGLPGFVERAAALTPDKQAALAAVGACRCVQAEGCCAGKPCWDTAQS